ncbi:tetratricopeptide repeat protein [Altererythrobacter sp. Z27]|uniref:tetratricopeptide repeat protein n=1 Tax=Altererythrobacter sp. Z27 TaxID=3461147 RepID=UPI004044FC2E
MRVTNSEAEQRLATLAGYLAEDPENVPLLMDCASASLDAGDCDLATELYLRIDALAPLSGVLANAAGIAAMRSGKQETAQGWFGRALEEAPDDVNVRFNLAWSIALAGDFTGAREWLDRNVVLQLPQAAMLDLQLVHELGMFDEAAPLLTQYLEAHPDYAPLNAVASVLAIDLDRADLARTAAQNGGDHPDALTTLGTLDLGDRSLDEARLKFEKALILRPHNPRAEIGLGLVELAGGNKKAAVLRLDKGAEQFEDHLGSWIAAGWAHFLDGDLDTAQARFATALEHDNTFGEAHGSMAVVELLKGNIKEAERRMEVAKRLDRKAFSTALASMLWEQSQGNPDKADQIFRTAVQQRVGVGGTTLLDELIKAMSGTSTLQEI